MSYSSVVLADSPYAYYRLQESSGTTAVDSSGNGRNATYVGTVAFGQTGPLSGDVAVSLDGETGGISTPVNPAGWATYSIEAWIYGTGISGNPFGIKSYSIPVIAASDRTDQDNTGFEAWFNENGSPRFDVSQASGGATNVNEGSALSTGQWYHVVFVNGSSNDEIIYVNGVAVASGGAAGALGGTYDITFGYQPNANYSQSNSFFKGYMAECAIYNTALTSSQVSNHYAAATASSSSTVNVSASGGSFTDGSASGTETVSSSAAGGSISGGSPSMSLQNYVSSNGGSVSGGNTPTSEGQLDSSSGGSESGGSSYDSLNDSTFAQGGSATGGSATGAIQNSPSALSDGGSTSGGRVSVSEQQSTEAVGGSNSGGSSSDSSIQQMSASGGSDSGGRVSANSGGTISVVASGGSSTGGAASPVSGQSIPVALTLQGSVIRTAYLDGSIVRTASLIGGLPVAVTNQNFALYVGQEFSFNISVSVDDPDFDFANSNLAWVMQPNVSSTQATVTKQLNDGIVIANAENGIFTVTLEPSDTTGKVPGVFYHEARITDDLGNPYPVTIGTVKLMSSAVTFP